MIGYEKLGDNIYEVAYCWRDLPDRVKAGDEDHIEYAQARVAEELGPGEWVERIRLVDGVWVGVYKTHEAADTTIEQAVLKKLMKVKSLAEKFGHLWATAVSDDEFRMLYQLYVEDAHHKWHINSRLRGFAKAVNELATLRSHPDLPGGRLLSLEGTRITYAFGGSDQLRIELGDKSVLVEYTNSKGNRTVLYYYQNDGKYRWLCYPPQPRDAARVVAIAQFFTGIPVDLDQAVYVNWAGDQQVYSPGDGADEYARYLNYFERERMGYFMAAPFEE